MTQPTPLDMVRQLVAAPYPDRIGDVLLYGIHESDHNFFRNGPRRKIAVLHDESGDFEQDADLTAEDQIEREIANLAVFKAVTEEMSAWLSDRPSQADAWPPDMPISQDFDDDEREDEALEDGSGTWTPSYEGGYHEAEIDRRVVWDLGDEYLVLFCQEMPGDGNFVCATGVCVLPKDGVGR